MTPRQALAVSVVGAGVGLVVVVISCVGFYVPVWQAVMWYVICGFFVVAFPWACLDWETRNRTIRAHNRLVYFWFAIIVVVLISQWGTEGQSFPRWGIGAAIAGALAAYSVMAYYAIANVRKWLRGGFSESDGKRT